MDALNNSNPLVDHLTQLVAKWQNSGEPYRPELEIEAENIITWKKKTQAKSLWNKPPLMLTATLDDGWGLGMKLIHLYSGVAGLRINDLGLRVPPEEIIEHCRTIKPDLLGLTVLQKTSEPALIQIKKNIPEKVKIIAGGAIFQTDPDLSDRIEINFVAKNISGFLSFLLKFQPNL